MLIGISGKIGSGKDTVGKIIQYLTNPFDRDMKTTFNPDEDYSAGCSFQIKKFAGKLKQVVSILTGIPVEDLEKQEIKEKVLGEEWDKYTNEFGLSTIKTRHQYTVRQILQLCGTEAMRNVIHPNIWVNALFADYKENFKGNILRKDSIENNSNWNYPNWIITDVRFPNELEAVKQRSGITIRVNRYCYDSAEDFLVTHPDRNVSKIGIDINMNENSSLIDFEEPARIHGYIPLKEQHPSETTLDNAEFDYTIDNNGTIEELIEKVRQILIKEKIIS